MSKSWLWVFVVWFISLLVGVLWGLLSSPGVNATRIGEGTRQILRRCASSLACAACSSRPCSYPADPRLCHFHPQTSYALPLHLRPSRRISQNSLQLVNVPI